MHLTSILWSDNIPKNRDQKDDDLRSYVNQGLLDGIRKFDPKRGSKFIYSPTYG
jgi:DNA-directed RNA polymerase specialized sigma subunit